MNNLKRKTLNGFALALLTCLLLPGSLVAAEIWNGSLFTFVQPGSDPTQAANQDRLTDNVWLTRAASQGLFNAASENLYTHNVSPAGTEWAYGTLDNYLSLSYTSWEVMNAANPPSMIGQNAVLHLIADDIYLSVRFLSWTSGGFGGFSYERSTPLVPEPSPSTMILLGLGLLFGTQHFRRWVHRRNR